jgi:enoyl-CoA hydratase/carnithine racemase
MSELILTRREEHLLLCTINRPQAMNALTFQALLDFRKILDGARADEQLRAVIITGAGDRGFCTGADLKERATLADSEVLRFLDNIRGLADDVEALPAPVIAAINGHALGGGTELALACDLRVAAETATLGLTECRLAIIPGGGGTQRLPRLVGPGRARHLILTGRRIDAAEALRIGLVEEVAPAGQALDRARALATEIAACGPVAVRQAKLAIRDGMQLPLPEALAFEHECYRATIPTEDRQEALRAFREKRPPRFHGR